MENNELKITDELLQNLSVDDIVDLKLEIEELLSEIDEIVQSCNEVLNY